MKGEQECRIYIGNIDERVTDRVLYEILIQAGPIMDLNFPVREDTKKSKGYAFAAYPSFEVANCAVELFTGNVVLYEKVLKFELNKYADATTCCPPLPTLILSRGMEAKNSMKELKNTLAQLDQLVKKARKLLQKLTQIQSNR